MIGTALLAVGCIDGWPEPADEAGEARTPRDTIPTPWGDDVVDVEPPDGYGVDPLVVTNGFLAGDMGRVQDFAGDAVRQDGTASEGHATFHVTSARPADNWAVMAILELDPAGLVPGNHVTSSGGTYVNLIGCSGARDGAWDFDAPAGYVDVAVRDGSTPETVQLNFVARFFDVDGSDQETSGSLETTVP